MRPVQSMQSGRRQAYAMSLSAFILFLRIDRLADFVSRPYGVCCPRNTSMRPALAQASKGSSNELLEADDGGSTRTWSIHPS